jgi:hypothetical protein
MVDPNPARDGLSRIEGWRTAAYYARWETGSVSKWSALTAMPLVGYGPSFE